MDAYGDLVAADDVLLFVNAAITSTGQREFHGDADEQRLSLDFLHAYMLGNYRDLYAGFGHLLRQDVLGGYRGRGRAPSR
ncbi:hypothetical protein [Streptomyces sp.]|uniref:hypothetical protein n=1 Tax=Streptomyces sp. TaxID=1931 RepID=UPI0035C6D1B4